MPGAFTAIQGRNAKMTLEIAALGLTHLVEGVKDLAPGSGGSPADRRRRHYMDRSRALIG
jgi:hypothetical protein